MLGDDGGEDVGDGEVDPNDASRHDEGFVCVGLEAMRGDKGVACLDHVPGMLDALLTGDCVCATAVHDNGACSPARFLKDVAGDEDRSGTECIEGEACGSRGRMGGSRHDQREI